MVGLQDNDDDVRAVAAEALLPVAAMLAARDDADVEALRSRLWDILLDLEELSPSTGSVMQLLAQLHPPSVLPILAAQLPDLAPRLWPFFRHALTPVRAAAVRGLSALLATPPGIPTGWLTGANLTTALRLVYQNLIMEGNAGVLEGNKATWRALLAAAQPQTLAEALPENLIGQWLDLAGTPEGQTLNPQALLVVPPPSRAGAPHAATRAASYVVGPADDGAGVSRMRLAAADALADLAYRWPPGYPNPFPGALHARLIAPSGTARLMSALVLVCWARHNHGNNPALAGNNLTAAAHIAPGGNPQAVVNGMSAPQPSCAIPQHLGDRVFEALALPQVAMAADGSVVPFAELAGNYANVRNAALVLLSQCAASGWDLQVLLQGIDPQQYVGMLTAESAAALSSGVPADPVQFPYLAAAKDNVVQVAEAAQAAEAFLHCSVCGLLAAAVVQMGQLPPKLNTVIRPLMAALRREPDPLLRDVAARGIAELAALYLHRQPSPNDKLVKNLCTMACGDPTETPNPSAGDPDSAALDEASDKSHVANGLDGPHPSATAAGVEDPVLLAAVTARLGAEAGLRAIATRFGASLIDSAGSLWGAMTSSLLPLALPDQAMNGVTPPLPQTTPEPQALMETLQILKVVGPVVHPHIHPAILALVPPLVRGCLPHGHSLVRRAAASCLASLCQAHPTVLLPSVLREGLPLLGPGGGEAARSGGVDLLAQLLRRCGMALLPYCALLVVPLMAALSDPAPPVRSRAASAFADVVALLPLAQGVGPPEGLEPAQLEAWKRDSHFLGQLLDNSKVDDYSLPVEIKGELRPYQRAGISWLAFLRRCGLHGVLADDMGLGKTLQATAIIAASHVERRQAGAPPRPSLIVCPPTLVQHWPHEMDKFLGPGVLRGVAYEGNPSDRQAIRATIGPDDVVVMSYESLRSDVEWVAGVSWDYCVLDEGHVIRNPKTKISQAAKRVAAAHRLILSGTPIQNNVLELWALFDFLMPGFLGSHSAFNARYGRALAASRTSKLGSQDAQAGLLAMEGLHKQVLPFILRRTKDTVLKELPPKILQDIMCEPSPLQARLIHDFSASPAGHMLGKEAASAASAQAPHVFQALQYMRKVCSHPLLVMDGRVAAHVAAASGVTGAPDWAKALPLLHQLHHAPKLLALRELLLECGIGVKAEEGDDVVEDGGGHRVLVFAQLKGLLDLVESDLLRPMGVPFLRLDGGVEASQRFGVVQRFNADPTIPVMLLTTHVGGLGLNLTAADTVIFLEHDWNPQNDLQAMDRAHRLGQKRTVNVYRLLMRGTLEERIMGLQRFKLDLAAAVVNQDNVSLKAMDTSQLLDLFAIKPAAPAPPAAGGDTAGEASAAAAEAAAGGAAGGAKKGGLKAVLEGLEELWDQNQYAEEFSLDTFVSKLS